MGSRRRGQLAHGADSAFMTTLRATIGLSRGGVHDAINSTLRILLCDGMRRTSDHVFAALRLCGGGPPGPWSYLCTRTIIGSILGPHASRIVSSVHLLSK